MLSPRNIYSETKYEKPCQGPFSSLPGAGFFEKLEVRSKMINSLLCIGLDPHTDQLIENSAQGALRFCKKLVDATVEMALAYKPNAAFFEAFGPEGISVLKELIQYIPAEIPVILDGKRGDIGTTAKAYADAAFKAIGADSVTVNSYMGTDTILPFTNEPGLGVFVLCKTSNPSSSEIQELVIQSSGRTIFEEIAILAEKWNEKNKNVGLVVGATDPASLKRVRMLAPNLWILSPGIGAQGGNLEDACKAGLSSNGSGMIFPISRAISSSIDPSSAAKKVPRRHKQS